MAFSFGGFLAALFSLFLSGFIWPHRGSISTLEFFFGNIVKSLWISWVLVAFCFLIKVELNFYLIFSYFVFLLFFMRIFFWKDDKSIVLMSKSDVYVLITIGAVILIFISLIIGAPFIEKQDGILKVVAKIISKYPISFEVWDGVVSWNRWAIELTNGVHQPLQMLYPIGWPGVWSIIYAGQENTEIWLIAKSTLWVNFVLIGLVFGLNFKTLTVSGRVMLILSIVWMGLFVARKAIFGGMDIPVTAMLLVSLLMLVYSIRNKDNLASDQLFNSFVLVAIGIGFAGVVKLPGAVGILFWFVILLIFKLHRLISVRKAVFLGVISVIPFLLYLVIFFLTPADPLGLTNTLENLAASKRGELPKLIWAMLVLSNSSLPPTLTPISILNIFALISMFALGLFNIFRIRTIEGQIGFIMTISAVIGFFLYSDCCAYSNRNGYWIVAFLIPGSLLFIDSTNTKRNLISSHEISKFSSIALKTRLIIFSGILLVLLTYLLPFDVLNKVERTARKNIVPENMYKLITEHLKSELILEKNWLLIYGYKPIKWLDEVRSNKNHYVFCDKFNIDCVKKNLESDRQVFVLTAKKGGKKMQTFRERHRFRVSELEIKKQDLNSIGLGIWEIIGPFEKTAK